LYPRQKRVVGAKTPLQLESVVEEDEWGNIHGNRFSFVMSRDMKVG
jgi:hypothetical protein